MEIKGKILKKLSLQSGESRNGGSWKRQEYLLEYGDRFPKTVCFSLRNDNVDKYPLEIDEEVVISVDVLSREYNGRYYTDVVAWKVDKASDMPQQAAPAATAQTFAPAAPTTASSADLKDESADDLPF